MAFFGKRSKHWKYKRFFTYAPYFSDFSFYQKHWKTNKFLLSQQIQNCSFGEIPEMFAFKNSTFWKSFKNHYTKWYFRFSKPGKSKHFCDWSQKAFVFAGGVEAKMILFQKCPIPMARNHQNMLAWIPPLKNPLYFPL